MALTDDGNTGGMIMPVAPMNNNGGFGFGNDSWAWILLLILLANGGWGMGGFGGFGGMMGMGMMDGFGLYPWLNNSQNINDGFREQMLNSNVQGIQQSITSGFGDVQTALCGGFAGVNASINGAQSALSQQMYGNEIANLERSYAAQTANTAGLTNIQAQLAQCCCDNRAATSDLKYTVATENCADRQAISDGIRDLIANQTAGTQRILDQLCQDKIDAKNDTINQLRSELLYARGQASQDVQTAAIQAGQRALANEVEQYVAPRAIPAYVVQNPNCCTQNCGCGF